MSSDQVLTLIEKVQVICHRVDEVTAAISSCTDETQKIDLTAELATLQTTEGEAKNSLFEWAKVTADVTDRDPVTLTRIDITPVSTSKKL